MEEIKCKSNVLVAIDVGSEASGIVIITDGKISLASTSYNEEIFDAIRKYMGVRYRLRVIIEDIKPYSLKLTPEVIETCKYIGELKYRLKTARIAFKLHGRNDVKRWVYNSFPEVVEQMIRTKINKKGMINKDGSERKSSFVWVDDIIITAAMRKHWNVGEGKRGKKNVYGLGKHSWQALGLASFYMSKYA